MKQLEDIFQTKEFKALNWKKRLWIRIQVAIAGFLEL